MRAPAEEWLWIKVLLYNPRDVGRAAELLRVRARLGRRQQGGSCCAVRDAWPALHAAAPGPLALPTGLHPLRRRCPALLPWLVRRAAR